VRAFDSFRRSSRSLHGLAGLALISASLCAFGSGACKPRRGETLPALQASSWLVDLDVPGFGPAKLAVPLGTRAPRSLVIALHGPADRPEWACSAFRGAAGPAPFVLCPRGIARQDLPAKEARYTFGSVDETARELRAALAAVKSRYGAYVAPGSVVLAGFELGADRAAAIAREEPAFFARVVLVDPPSSVWSSSLAAVFGRQGGERVLFACGSAACRDEYQLRAELTLRGGAQARSIRLPEAALGPVAAKALREAWPWLSSANRDRKSPEILAGSPLSGDGPIKPDVR